MLATNIVAGASVLFWDASPDGFKDRTQRGPRFKALVAAQYPWCSEDGVDAEFGALLLWDYARNPLSHTLGVGKTAQLFPGIPQKERGVWLSKFAHGLDQSVVEQAMSSRDRPIWMDATITDEPGGYVVQVATLAWGVTRLLRKARRQSGWVAVRGG